MTPVIFFKERLNEINREIVKVEAGLKTERCKREKKKVLKYLEHTIERKHLNEDLIESFQGGSFENK